MRFRLRRLACPRHSPQPVNTLRSQSQSERIDTHVQIFLNRPLEGNWPCIWIDGIYLKVRQNARVVLVALFIAVGARCRD